MARLFTSEGLKGTGLVAPSCPAILSAVAAAAKADLLVDRAGWRSKDKVARAGRLRQEMTMKLKLDCQTIQQGCGGFPGQPAARSAKKTKICGYAGDPCYEAVSDRKSVTVIQFK
jgi:hypothetical protein